MTSCQANSRTSSLCRPLWRHVCRRLFESTWTRKANLTGPSIRIYTLGMFETLNVRFNQLTQLNVSGEFLYAWACNGEFVHFHEI